MYDISLWLSGMLIVHVLRTESLLGIWFYFIYFFFQTSVSTFLSDFHFFRSFTFFFCFLSFTFFFLFSHFLTWDNSTTSNAWTSPCRLTVMGEMLRISSSPNDLRIMSYLLSYIITCPCKYVLNSRIAKLDMDSYSVSHMCDIIADSSGFIMSYPWHTAPASPNLLWGQGQRIL